MPDAKPLSAMERIINIFVSPSKTFNDLNRDASWWLPWLIMSLFAVLFVCSVQTKIGWDQTAENMVGMSPKQTERMDRMSPEQRDQQMSMMSKSMQYTSYMWPIMALIFFVIMAAVLMATFNFGMGAEIPFGKSLAVVIYGSLPGLIKSLLVSFTLLAGRDPEGFNLRNPLASNLGFLVDSTDHPALYAVLSSVDVFGIWILILLGIGYSCVSKVKSKSSTSVVAGWYVFVTLLGAGWASLFE